MVPEDVRLTGIGKHFPERSTYHRCGCAVQKDKKSEPFLYAPTARYLYVCVNALQNLTKKLNSCMYFFLNCNNDHNIFFENSLFFIHLDLKIRLSRQVMRNILPTKIFEKNFEEKNPKFSVCCNTLLNTLFH